MKLAVYGICKNEAQFVERFMTNLGEADGVYISDTGSDDKTVELLRSHGAIVFDERIDPFRFDFARNRALANVPSNVDVVISLDLDEVIEPGWREKIETEFANNPSLTSLCYHSIYTRDRDNRPKVSLPMDRIHRRSGFSWVYPVHETLRFEQNGIKPLNKYCSAIVVNHYPDVNKPRKYDKLMDIAISEYPDDRRMVFFYAREKARVQHYGEALQAYRHYLKLTEDDAGGNGAVAQYRGMVCRNIGKIVDKQGGSMLPWMLRAVGESQFSRENWYWLAKAWMKEKNWPSVKAACANALLLNRRENALGIEEAAWDDEVIKAMMSGAGQQRLK